VARTVTVALRRGGAQLVFEAQKGTNSLQSLLTDPQRRTLMRLSLHVVPFAGIAFLWFIGLVRDQLGGVEDRLGYLVGLTLLVAAGAYQWTQLGFPAWVLLFSLVILFDRPLSHDSHPAPGS
jgi:hypothetical protein